MRVAVVGPTGVLGRALVPALLQQGYAVRALARTSAKARRLFPQVTEIVECDLLASVAEELPAMLDGCDTVMHIATAIPRDFMAPHAWDANTRLRTDGVKMLLAASLKAGVRRYIQQSITMAYPDHGDSWITEEMPLDASPERARVCAPVMTMEQMIRDTPVEELEWCILRGGSFVGQDTFQDDTLERLRLGQEIVPCDGRNFTSLIHVSDVATAFVAAVEHAPAGSVFNVVAEPLRQGDYLDRLADSSGAPRPRRDQSAHCPPSWRCSNQAAKARLKWQPLHGVTP
ncbi:MAG: NAD-dependent epimerase/dehydratase family protein [Caldilineaceae bacterium]|nr:NAD-dependent epimerase/dehydratase family protein [Caldilineaceae bacterium]